MISRIFLLFTLFIFFTCEKTDEAGEPNIFFAMDTGTGTGSAHEKAQILQELGYAGTDFSALPSFGRDLSQLTSYLATLDSAGLRLFAVYISLNIDGALECPPEISETAKNLSGRQTVLWLSIVSHKFKPASEEGDRAVVLLVSHIAKVAAGYGLRIALYPHFHHYAERITDNLRLVRLVNLPNVGLTFNLCHWLKSEKGENLDQILEQVMPHLMMVTINGADFSPDQSYGWDRLIQPLDSGNYDVFHFVQQIRKAGYRGPIGLQGYGIPGDPKRNLARSMNTWQSFQAKMN